MSSDSRPPRILAFAGSTRQDSYNKKLVQIAAMGARSSGAEVSYIDLREYELPLFDQDLENDQGLPANALELKRLFLEHDGLLISAPEYNTSITGVLKNTIDWVSRKGSDQRPLAAFRGKTAALMSASPGKLGGLRGLVQVRAILGNIGVLVLPNQVAVPEAATAFDEKGWLVDERLQGRVEALGQQLTEVVVKLNPSR